MMRAWRVYGVNDIRLDEVPIPETRPGWVLVRIKVVQPSITECVHLKGGLTIGSEKVRQLIREKAPVQLWGHEFSGEVIDIGEGVTRFSKGDRVASRTDIPCGKCGLCLSGKSDQCHKGSALGYDYPGCFAEYALLPELVLTKLPASIDDNEGALIQPFSDALQAVASAQLEAGDTIAVLGQGVMGLMLLQAARVLGAGTTIVTDISDAALELSREFGADYALNVKNIDVVDRSLKLTNDVGVDIVFDAAGGSPQLGLAGTTTLEQALQIVRDCGKIVVVAMVAGSSSLDLVRFRMKSVRMLFADDPSLKTLEYAVKLVASGRVRLRPIISHVLEGLDKLPEAFEITADKKKYGATGPAQIVVSK